MKVVKAIYGLFVFGLFLWFFVLIMNVVGYSADVVVERPVYSVSDYWIFTGDGKDVRLEFLREEKDRYIFNLDGVQVVKDFDLTEEKRKRDYRGPLVKFPIKVGKVWTYDFEVESIRTVRFVGRQAKYVVAAYEQITVPAGTFWSFKITLSIYETTYWEKGFSTEYWYAPDVKQIIRFSKEEKN